MRKIYVIHENEAWLPPLRDALRARGLPFQEWHMAGGAIDLDAPPPDGVFYNRMSASSHSRGHRYAPEYTASVLAWLESHGRRLINSGRALELELSKAKQYAALKTFGVRTPATRVAVGRTAVLEAAQAMGAPVILKPNRGGKGLGVQLFNDLAAVEAYVESDLFDDGPDGTVLVQQYVKPADGAIIRNEFVGGKLLYAVRVDASKGFELCPADVCAVEDRFCPVGEQPTTDNSGEQPTTDNSGEQPDADARAPQFRILDGFAHENHARYARFLAANGIEVAGIEMILDPEGEAWTYDVNTNTNYNPDAERAAGIAGSDRSGMGAVAAFLGRELARLEDGSRHAAE